MEHLIQEAFRVAIQTEMKSYRSYRDAAVMMPDGNAKNVLETLAEEELKIIEEIRKHCPCPPAIVEQPEEQQVCAQDPCAKESPERKLCRQLRAALVDRHCSMEKYMIFATSFKEPRVCQLFELALSMSRRHFDLISRAYSQAEQRLDRPRLDRRKKRIHLRPLSRGPVPNEHTELFVSLLESGRLHK